MSQNVRFGIFLVISVLCHSFLLFTLPSFRTSETYSEVWVNLVELPKAEIIRVKGDFLLKGKIGSGQRFSEKADIISLNRFSFKGTVFTKGFRKTLKLKIKRKAYIKRVKKEGERKRGLHIVKTHGDKTAVEKSVGKAKKSQTQTKLVPPKPLKLTKPKYPFIAKRMGYEGVVVLDIEVLPDGSVGKVKIVESSGHELLDKAAIKEVKKWKFVPAMRGGKPVRSVVREKIIFKLR